MSKRIRTIDELIALLKSAGYITFQDVAVGTAYPYIVYSFVSDRTVRASNKAYRHVRKYSVSLFTTETASALTRLTGLLDGAQVPYQAFVGMPGNENDSVVTNFYTYMEFEAI